MTLGNDQVKSSNLESSEPVFQARRTPVEYASLAKLLDQTGRALEQTQDLYQRICYLDKLKDMYRTSGLSEHLDKFVELFYQIQNDLSQIRPDWNVADEPSYVIRYCDHGCSKRVQMRKTYGSLLIKLEGLLFSKFVLCSIALEHLEMNEGFDQYDRIYFEVANKKINPVSGLRHLIQYSRERTLVSEEIEWCQARQSEEVPNSEGLYRVLTCDRYCQVYLRFLREVDLISDQVLPSPFVHCKNQVISEWIVLVKGTSPAHNTQQILDYLVGEYFEDRYNLYLHFEDSKGDPNHLTTNG